MDPETIEAETLEDTLAEGIAAVMAADEQLNQPEDLADLFEVPLVWFFQDIGQNDTNDNHAEQDDDAEREAGLVVYRVATIEHRIAALVESFRQLDFEGQQHLLAISRELSRPARG